MYVRYPRNVRYQVPWGEICIFLRYSLNLYFRVFSTEPKIYWMEQELRNVLNSELSYFLFIRFIFCLRPTSRMVLTCSSNPLDTFEIPKPCFASSDAILPIIEAVSSRRKLRNVILILLT